MVLKDGHKIFPDKTKAIFEFGVPRNESEVRGFLVSVNFLRRFWKDISQIFSLLTALTGDVPFVWGNPQQESFEKVESLIVLAPALAHPDFKKPFILETEASRFAAGAVILQIRDNGLEHPISFSSRKMQLTEINYPIYDKELSDIMEALNKWQHHLLYARHPFLVCMDPKALEYYKSPR